MKRPRCTHCKHKMKGHKRSKCNKNITLILPDNSSYTGSAYNNTPDGKGIQKMLNGDCYNGEFVNGVRHGKGSLTTKRFTYEGDWKNNCFDGNGKIFYRSGETYEGSFSKGQRHGAGFFVKTPTIWYKGDWINNVHFGDGIESSIIGVYTGKFENDKKHGKGTMVYSNGHTFEGHWFKNIRNGFGILKTLTFSYQGQWSNDKYHGHGTLTCLETGVYKGMWKHGQRHRNGHQTYLNKDVYDGKWSRDVRCGFGSLKSANGDIYKGTWINDMKNGHGSFETSTYQYKGEWLNNYREGNGIIIEDNYILKGTWYRNKRHGIFEKHEKKVLNKAHIKQLWFRGKHISIKNKKAAEKNIKHWLKQKEYDAAKWAAIFFPDVITWKFIMRHDVQGFTVCLKDKNSICSFLKNKSWSLFKKKNYALIKACVQELSDDFLIVAMEHETVKLLFDSLTDEFEPNPWIVSQASYSKKTKDKLLKGLHLGEFGRCNPIDPFTRQRLSEESGIFLSEDIKRAKRVWKCFKECLSKQPTIRRLEYEFNMNDYEELLTNARETNDTNTMRVIMKERDDYITRERSSSLSGV